MAKRYQGADIATVIVGLVALIGTALPWGKTGLAPVNPVRSVYHSEQVVAALLALGAVVIALAVPHRAFRKASVPVLGIAIVVACSIAIGAVNRTKGTEDFSSYATEENVTGGLWTTLLSGVGLLFSGLSVRARDRQWAPMELSAPDSGPPSPVPAPLVDAGSRPDWTRPTARSPVRKLKCPKCGTAATVYGSETPQCPNCGFRA